MAENQFFIDSDKLSEAALEHKHKLETDPSSRTNHMEYMEGMEQIDSDIMDKVLEQMNSYDYEKYTAKEVQTALEHETCTVASISAIRFICLRRFILQTTVRITAFTVDSTVTMTFIERS